MLQNIIAEAATPLGLRVKILRTDGRDEYSTRSFNAFCRDNSIERQRTARYSPQQNGIAERLNRTLVEMARTMLIHAALPKVWWSDAILYSAYIRVRVPTAGLDGDIPIRRYTDRAPTYEHMRTFGAVGYVHVPDIMRTKFDTKAVRCIFVGFDSGRKSFKMYSPDSKRIIHSRDLDFDETMCDAHDILVAEKLAPDVSMAYPSLQLQCLRRASSR